MDLKFSTKGRVNLLQMKSVSHFLDTAFKCEQLLPISTLEFSQLQGIWKFSFPLSQSGPGKRWVWPAALSGRKCTWDFFSLRSSGVTVQESELHS